MPSPTVPLILDVDTGIDDSIGLLYLLGSPEADIVAITCSAGNVAVDQVTTNTLAWLDVCGRDGIEVATGSDHPLSGPAITATEVHGDQGLGYAELPPPTRDPSPRGAAEVWATLARERPGELTGLTTGPLTNLARALEREPELPHLLNRLVVMGGAFEHRGNTTPTAEWNIAVDPEAAKIVFDAFSALPPDRQPIICPLDITERITMTPTHLADLSRVAGSTPVELISPDDPADTRSGASNPVVRHLSDQLRFYMRFHAAHGHGFAAHMHDPFAAAVAIDPALAVTRAATVDVELVGTLTRGQTVADWSGMWGRSPNARIVTGTDPEEFFRRLVDRVGRLARARGGHSE